MRQISKCALLTALMVAGIFKFNVSHAQNNTDALAYMESMTVESFQILEDTWGYTSAVAHGKSAKKVESKRQTLLSTIEKAKARISKVPAFEGSTGFRDSILSYLILNYHVIKEEYAKILDMEEIAEQSYDLMEAYLLAQDKANEKIRRSGEMIDSMQRSFAEAHNITLMEGGKDKTSAKLERANEVFQYYRDIYLVFFKSYKQEIYLTEALNKGDVNALEQNKNALLKYAEEGKAKLDTMKSFRNDVTLKTSCRSLLIFYQSEASEKIPELINFYLVKDNYEKTKTAFEAKPQSKRTQADVDQYNKAVADFNASVNKFNAVNQEINGKRSKLLETWNQNVTIFLDKHVPQD